MIGWITIILGALRLLIQWLNIRKSKCDELNDRQQNKLNELIYQTNECRDLAVALGCKPEGTKPETKALAEAVDLDNALIEAAVPANVEELKTQIFSGLDK